MINSIQMKLQFFSLMILVFFGFNKSINAQQGMPIDAKTGLVSYSEVIESPVQKNELYQRAKIWSENNTYSKGLVTTITDDKEMGRIVARGNFLLTQNQKSYYVRYINFKLTIECKDNKWRYEVTKLYTYNYSQGVLYTMDSEKANAPIEKSGAFDITDFSKKNKNAQNTDELIMEIISSLKENMDKPIIAEELNW